MKQQTLGHKPPEAASIREYLKYYVWWCVDLYIDKPFLRTDGICTYSSKRSIFYWPNVLYYKIPNEYEQVLHDDRD